MPIKHNEVFELARETECSEEGLGRDASGT